MNSLRHPLPRPVRPHGSVAVPFALILPVVLGMMGLAIDLSIIYLRNTEMQQMADSTAMAAARRLDGTLAGVNAAKQDATDMAQRSYYDGIYRTASGGSPTQFANGDSWSTDALFFSSAPSGAEWKPAESVTDATTAAAMMYAKVDTGRLTNLPANPGRVATTLMRFLGAPDNITVAPVAVAGKSGMQVMPLAICALNNAKFTPRASSAGNELVEYGYRRGVPYDLLKLSPAGTSAQNYLLNPIDGGNVATPDPAHLSHDFIKPFFCSGSIAYPTLRSGGSVHVAPLPDIHEWLNSRFNDYTGSGDACPARNGAPPDTNIKEFTPSTVGWITTDRLSARSYSGTALVTVADPVPVPANVEVKHYGPLWVYAKPVKFVSASLGAGTTPVAFKLTDWPALYQTTAGPAITVPSLTYKDPPYTKDGVVAPTSGLSVFKRRIINLPLLDCSGAVGSTATVVGVGSFLLTAKSTSGSVFAEFDGLVDESNLVGNVRRYQ